MFAVWSSSHFLSFFPRKWWLFTLGDVGLPDRCFIVCLVLLTSSYFFIFKLPENLVFLAAAIFSPGVFLQVLSLISVRYWLPNLNFYLLFSLKAVFTFLSVGLAEMGVIMLLFYFWTETYALYFLLLCSFLRTRLMVNVFLELVVTVKRLVDAMASDSFHDGRRPSRTRALTVKGSALFEEQVSKFQSKLLQKRRLLDLALEERTSEHNLSMDTLRVKHNNVAQLLFEYETLSSEYLNFLSRNYHADSQREAAAHNLVLSSVESRVYAVLRGIYVIQDSIKKKSSLRSISVSHKDTGSASSSRWSVSSSSILKQRCKVQAAKAELAFLRHEAELQREKVLVSLQQNNINSELKILAKAKEAAVAKSKLNVLCEMDYEKSDTSDILPLESFGSECGAVGGVRPDQFPHHTGSVYGAGAGPPYSPDIPPCVSNISLNDGSDDFSHAFQNRLYVTSAAPAKPGEVTLDPVSRPLPHEPANQHVSYMAAADPRVLSMPLYGGSDGLSHGPRSVPHINVSAPAKYHEACTPDPIFRSLPHEVDNQHVSQPAVTDDLWLLSMSLCGGSDSPSHGLQTVPHVSVSAPVKSPEACTADPDPRSLHYVTNNQHVSHTFAADPRVSRMPLGGESAATDGPSYGLQTVPHVSGSVPVRSREANTADPVYCSLPRNVNTQGVLQMGTTDMTDPRVSNVTFSGVSNDVSHGFQTLSYDNSAVPINSHEPCTVNQVPCSLPNNANSQGISHLSGNNTGVSNMSLSYGSNNITSGCQTVPVISHDACAVRPVPCSIPHHANTQFPCTPCQNDLGQVSQYAVFSNHLFKRDLLLTRLSKFEDSPETFLTWKNSFKSVMSELGVNAGEELDLLIKYLGKDSSKSAVSMKSANPGDPVRGLSILWDRLDERYGSPELVEATLKAKLTKFPKILQNQLKRLYDLSDILAEVECVMNNPSYLPLFSYFNSSAGVNPIVSKLPGMIQAKWADRVVKYKSRNRISYPPFGEFCAFIREMSARFNDPSLPNNFAASAPSASVSNSQGSSFNAVPLSSKPKNIVSSRKTAVSEVGVKYPIHNGAHVLTDCRAFLKKISVEAQEHT